MIALNLQISHILSHGTAISQSRYLMFLLERGDIKPKVSERVPLNGVPDAQRLVQSGRANGTLVCVPWVEDEEY